MARLLPIGLVLGRLSRSLRRSLRHDRSAKRGGVVRKGEDPKSRAASVKAAAAIRPGLGETLITPLSPPFARWMPEEAVVVTGAASESGKPLDIASLPLPTGGERIRDLRLGQGVHVPLAIRLNPGDVLRLPQDGGTVELLSAPEAGLVRIETAGLPPVFADLEDVTPRPVNIGLPEVGRSHGSRRISARKLRLAAFEQALENGIVSAMAAPASSDAQAATLVVYTPRRSDAAVAAALFDRTLAVPADDGHPDDLTPTEIELCATRLAALPMDRIVMAGCDAALLRLAEAVRRRRRLDIDLLWHGGFIDMGVPEDWRLLTLWLDAAKSGVIRRIGVVAQGFEGFLRNLGFDARYVQNRVAGDPGSLVPPTVRDVVGIWLPAAGRSFDQPYSSLCALAELRQITITGAGLDHRALALAKELGLTRRDLRSEPLTPSDLRLALRGTTLTLSVASADRAPLLSLQSLSEGVPCLLPPSCDLFRDEPDLRDLYVAERPGHPAYLAGKIRELLGTADASFPRLMAYLAAWNAASAASIEAFLADDPPPSVRAIHGSAA
jgi:hypothetical protein